MYCIDESTKNMTGYLLLDNMTLCSQNEKNGEIEIKQAKVEIFGACTKITYDDNSIEHIFTKDVTDIRIVSEVNPSLFLIFYHGIIIAGSRGLYDSLVQYSNNTIKYKDFFESQYKRLRFVPDNPNTKNINDLTGIEFEKLCCNLLYKMGFEIETTKASGDGGIDIIAKTEDIFFKGTYLIQCKRYSGSVGEPIVRDLYGVVNSERANKGIIITTGEFTKSAIEFAYGKQIELIDGEKLQALLEKYQVNWDFTDSHISRLFEILEENCSLDKYNEKINILKSNPKEDSIRLSLIELLSEIIYDDYSFIEQDKKDILIKEAKKQIDYYSKFRNKSNKKTKYVDAVLSAIYIDFSIIEGDFVSAIKKYKDLIVRPEMYVRDWENINQDFYDNVWMISCLLGAAYNAVQIATLTNNKLFIDRIYNSAKGVIDVMREHYDSVRNNLYDNYTEQQIRYGRIMYDKLQKVKETNCFFINNTYLLRSASDYAYLCSPSFPYSEDIYDIVINEDCLEIKIGDYSKLAKIKNYSEKVNELIKYFLWW